MSKSYLFKLGAPILALSLVAACGNDDEPDPVEDDAPIEDEMEEEAPLTDEDEAPLNQEDDNGAENPMEEEGTNGENGTDGTDGGENGGTNEGNGAEDELIEDDGTGPDDAGTENEEE